MPAPLSAAPPLERIAWLAFRILAAVVTVPIAEELAYRGFLYRRLLSGSWIGLAVSSLVFGIPHGSRWIAAALAGACYALALRRKGSIGNAVAAHAVTNALIAADVVLYPNWNLW
jgi:CAAX prenyl protease-like protein